MTLLRRRSPCGAAPASHWAGLLEPAILQGINRRPVQRAQPSRHQPGYWDASAYQDADAGPEQAVKRWCASRRRCSQRVRDPTWAASQPSCRPWRRAQAHQLARGMSASRHRKLAVPSWPGQRRASQCRGTGCAHAFGHDFSEASCMHAMQSAGLYG
jgi:hypothetical protein